MLGRDPLLRESALELELTQQTREIIPILVPIAVAIVFAIATNFGGFAKHLLLASFAKQSAFAAFLATTYILILQPKKHEMATIIVMFAAVGIARNADFLAPPSIGATVWLLGLIAILPTAVRQGYGAARLYFVASASLLLPLASTLALIGQQLTITGSRTLDIPAYLIDSSYGISAPAILGRIIWAYPSTHLLLKTVYGWLPAAVSTCYALNVRAGNPDAGVLLKAALAAGAIAFGLYHLYSAAGPIYAFGPAFPASLPAPSSLLPARAALALPGAPRNCMPSVHLGWAILAVVEARGLGRVWRAVFILFAGLTACATIALREHYLIDLVVAVPFTLCVHAVFARKRAWVIGWRGTPCRAAWRHCAGCCFCGYGHRHRISRWYFG